MENVEENEPIDLADELMKAASFLANLGTSLQKRSESVIEKKLTGNKKLSKSQYKKVAEKLLLICELSKKSIENFEKGLKKIIEHLCKSTADDKSDSSDYGLVRETKFKLYSYGTTDLKVPLSVNYKHYLSCKVDIVPLATPTFEKYLALHNNDKSSDNASDIGSTSIILPNDTDKPINDNIENKYHLADNFCKTNQENSVANENNIDSSDFIQSIDIIKEVDKDNNGDIDCNESNKSDESAAADVVKPKLKLVSLQKLLKPDHTVLNVFKDNEKNKLLAEAIHNEDINEKDNIDESPSKKVITIASSDEESVKDIEPTKNNPVESKKRKSRKSSSDSSQSDDPVVEYKKKRNRRKRRKLMSDSEESDVSSKNNKSKTKSKKSSDSDIEISFKQVKKRVRFTFDENSRPRRDSNVSNRSDSSLKETQDINENISVNVESDEEAQIRRKAVADFKPRKLSLNIEKMGIPNEDLLQKHNLKRIIQNGRIIVEAEKSLSNDDLLASSNESASDSLCVKKRRKRSRPVINSETESDTEDEELVKALEEIRKEIQEMTQKDTATENKDESSSEYVTSDEELTKVLTEIKSELEQKQTDTTKDSKLNSELYRKISVSSSESSGTEALKRTVASIEKDIEDIVFKGSNDSDFYKEVMDGDNTDLANAKDGF